MAFSLFAQRERERASCISSSSYKDTSHITLGPRPYDLNCLLKVLSPNTVTLGLGLEHMNFGGDTVQSVGECTNKLEAEPLKAT